MSRRTAQATPPHVSSAESGPDSSQGDTSADQEVSFSEGTPDRLSRVESGLERLTELMTQLVSAQRLTAVQPGPPAEPAAQKAAAATAASAVNTFRDGEDDARSTYSDGSSTSSATRADAPLQAPDGSAVPFDTLVTFLCDLDDQAYGPAFVYRIRRIRRIASSLARIWEAAGHDPVVGDALGVIATDLGYETSVIETEYEDGAEVAQEAARLLEARVASHPMRRSLNSIQVLARKNIKARRAALPTAQPRAYAAPPPSQHAAPPQPAYGRAPRDTKAPPRPCRYCRQGHWERECPLKPSAAFAPAPQYPPFGYAPPQQFAPPPPPNGGAQGGPQ